MLFGTGTLEEYLSICTQISVLELNLTSAAYDRSSHADSHPTLDFGFAVTISNGHFRAVRFQFFCFSLFSQFHGRI